MVKIIETNLMLDNNEIKDFQSRVIEMSSWSDYINEFINPKYESLEDCVGGLDGAILLKSMKIVNLEYNDHTLSCDCVLRDFNSRAQKIAYLAKEV